MRYGAVLLLVFALSCAETEGQGPFRVAVLKLEEGATSWSLEPVTIHTADSIVEVSGEAAELLGGARLVIDEEKIFDALLNQGATISEIREMMIKREGRPPRVSFGRATVAGEPDVLVPLDFDGLALVTAYHQLERARELALSLGMPEGCLKRIVTYYETRLTYHFGHTYQRIKTNAMFSPPLGAIILLPYDLDDLPFGMNLGVVGHEYAHAVWHCLVDALEWPPYSAYLDAGSYRHIYSLDEGLADFFGALLTGEPSFLTASLPIATERDMSGGWVYTSDLLQAVETGNGYDPYVPGTVLASSLWEIASRHGDPVAVGRAVFASMEHLSTRIRRAAYTSWGVDVFDYLDDLILAFSDEAPDAELLACNVLQSRYGAVGTISECR